MTAFSQLRFAEKKLEDLRETSQTERAKLRYVRSRRFSSSAEYDATKDRSDVATDRAYEQWCVVEEMRHSLTA